MQTRLRLGAATAVGLGALLLATVLASPALAWHANVTVTPGCLEGQVRVHYGGRLGEGPRGDRRRLLRAQRQGHRA